MIPCCQPVNLQHPQSNAEAYFDSFVRRRGVQQSIVILRHAHNGPTVACQHMLLDVEFALFHTPHLAAFPTATVRQIHARAKPPER